MKTISFDISDHDYKQLTRLAELRALTTEQLVREMVLESRHTILAEIRFLRRATRGRGREELGRALLDKAAGIDPCDHADKVPNAETRAAMFEVKLIGRLSNLAREVIDGIDPYSPERDKHAARKISKQ